MINDANAEKMNRWADSDAAANAYTYADADT